jgi:hypothetical protein
MFSATTGYQPETAGGRHPSISASPFCQRQAGRTFVELLFINTDKKLQQNLQPASDFDKICGRFSSRVVLRLNGSIPR